MAGPAGSRARRSRLIREMSRDLNRTEDSIASSTGSDHGTVTESTIDFELNDTAERSGPLFGFDSSQQLPPLRNTSRQYASRFSPTGQRPPKYYLNTDAINKLFPDLAGNTETTNFTELARVTKAKARGSPPMAPVDLPTISSLNPSPNVTSEHVPLASANHKVQPLKAHESRYASNASIKENIPPTNKDSSYTSGATIGKNGEFTRKLSELKAKVRDEFDRSLVVDARGPTPTSRPNIEDLSTTPPSAELPQSLRTSGMVRHFSKQSVDSMGGSERASVFNSINRLNATEDTPPKPRNIISNDLTANHTQNSFIVPRVPEFPDLVSGPIFDSSYAFSRNKPSKFASSVLQHNGMDGVALPETDRKLFVALQEAEERIQALETEKASVQTTVDDLRKQNSQMQLGYNSLTRENQSLRADVKNAQQSSKTMQIELQGLYQNHEHLESQIKTLRSGKDSLERDVEGLRHTNHALQLEIEDLEKYRRSDSAFGSSASEHHCCECAAKLSEENSKLVARLAGLEKQLEERNSQLAELDAQVANFAAKSIKDADRLTESIQMCETLREEVAFLRDDGDSVRAQLEQYEDQVQEMVIQWRTKESKLKQELECVKMVKLRQETNVDMIAERHHQEDVQTGSERHVSQTLLDTNARDISGSKSVSYPSGTTAISSLDRAMRSNGRETATTQSSGRGRAALKTIPSDSVNRPRSRPRSQPFVIVEEATATTQQDTPFFIASDSEPEVEHVAPTAQRPSSAKSDRAMAQSIQRSESRAPSKGIMKKTAEDAGRMSAVSAASRRSYRRHSDSTAEITQDFTALTVESKGTATGASRRHHSLPPSPKKNENHNAKLASRQQKTSKMSSEDLTSAFLAPDLKFHPPQKHISLTSDAKKVLDNLVSHDGDNCTYCSRVSGFEKSAAGKRTLRITRPIPVSDEYPKVQPAMTPGLALARTLKMLSDEVSHLKMNQVRYQTIYNGFSLSRADCFERNVVSKKLQKLQDSIDRKADQIFYMYQVLEGQKASGQEMTQSELDITLRSIGVDTIDAEMTIDTVKSVHTSRRTHEHEDSDLDSDLDLPWEGIQE